MSRTTLAIFLLMLVMGLGGGLYIGWVAYPPPANNISPSSLQQNYKDDYVVMIATLYAQEGDLAAAQARLAALDRNSGLLVTTTASRLIAAQAPEVSLRQLAHLGAGLGYVTPEMQVYLEP